MGSLCHGPAALASLSLLSTDTNVPLAWPLVNRKMTVFSNNEEKVNEASWGAKLGFYPQDLLTNLGALVSEAAIPYSSHVVTDGNLVTGQNPQSATDFGIAFVKLLESTKSTTSR